MMGLRTTGWRPIGHGLAFLIAAVPLAVMADGQQASEEHQHHQHHQVEPAETETVEARRIPDVAVFTQDGDEVHFYRDLVADRVVAMNFIFTTCTTICPPMGAIFGKLQRDLGERVGRDVHLISVSVDPTTDTPERLKAWSERFRTGPGWTLVTGRKAEVDRLLKSLEVFTPDYADHSPIVLVGNDRAQTWKRTYGLAPTAKLTEIIDEMSAASEE